MKKDKKKDSISTFIGPDVHIEGTFAFHLPAAEPDQQRTRLGSEQKMLGHGGLRMALG